MFILQIEGKKRWCLYEPIQRLAFLDCEDLKQDEIGGITHEFVLEVWKPLRRDAQNTSKF